MATTAVCMFIAVNIVSLVSNAHSFIKLRPVLEIPASMNIVFEDTLPSVDFDCRFGGKCLYSHQLQEQESVYECKCEVEKSC